MKVTWLTQDSELWKREKQVMKYTQDISFPKVWKILETTFPAWPYSRITQPIQSPSATDCQCNLLIEELLNLKLDKFPTFLKELWASIPPTQQALSSNPISTPKPTQEDQMTLSSSFQSWKPLQNTRASPNQRPSFSPNKTTILCRNLTERENS